MQAQKPLLVLQQLQTLHNYRENSSLSWIKSQNLNDSRLIFAVVFVQPIETRC